MRIKSIILFSFVLFFNFEIKAQQNKTEHRIESKVLLAVIDEKILDKPIELKIIKKFDFKTFKVFNSYKNEYLSVDSVKIMYVTPFDGSRKSFVGQEIGPLSDLKANIKNVLNGDIIAISAIITISGVKYRIWFSYITKSVKEELFFMASDFSQLEMIK